MKVNVDAQCCIMMKKAMIHLLNAFLQKDIVCLCFVQLYFGSTKTKKGINTT
jgi:hypothetical protein